MRLHATEAQPSRCTTHVDGLDVSAQIARFDQVSSNVTNDVIVCRNVWLCTAKEGRLLTQL